MLYLMNKIYLHVLYIYKCIYIYVDIDMHARSYNLVAP